MEILSAPTLESPVGEVRALFTDQAFGVVTTAGGALALLFYCVFAVQLFKLLRGAEGRAEPWRLAGLVGGLGGPLVAAVGLTATALLVAGGGDSGQSDDTVRSLFDLSQHTRTASGAFVVLFLLGFGICGLRSGALPKPLARVACLLAPLFLLGPVAALSGSEALRVAVAIAFGLQTLWILATSLWLLLAESATPATFVRRAAFLVLSLAAGLVGLGLLAAPGATGRFFSWNLEPEPLAAYAGGVYVGSALAYGVAVMRPWREARPLVGAAVVLSLSVFVASVAHREVFDFDRLQTWAWFVLFAGFGVITLGLLAAGGAREAEPPPGARLPPWARALLGTLALLLGALALALWIDPVALADPSPFPLPLLGGRFAGAWIALLAVLAGWAAARNGADEAWLPALALIALPCGALVAALRTLGDLDPAGAAAAYMAVLALVAAAGLAVLRAALPRRRQRPAGRARSREADTPPASSPAGREKARS